MPRYQYDGYTLDSLVTLTEEQARARIAEILAEDRREDAEATEPDDRPESVRRAGAALDQKFAES